MQKLLKLVYLSWLIVETLTVSLVKARPRNARQAGECCFKIIFLVIYSITSFSNFKALPLS